MNHLKAQVGLIVELLPHIRTLLVANATYFVVNCYYLFLSEDLRTIYGLWFAGKEIGSEKQTLGDVYRLLTWLTIHRCVACFYYLSIYRACKKFTSPAFMERAQWIRIHGHRVKQRLNLHPPSAEMLL